MLQELFRIPGLNIPVYGYGFMLVIGFILATQLAQFLARRSKIDPEVLVNAGIIALVAGVIGARLSHVLENLPDYTRSDLSLGQNLLNMIDIRSGGLTFYGGFLLAFPACVFYGWYKKVPIRRGMDIIAPCLMIGLGFGRIGCFLNGCCYGAECEAPWAVQFPYYSNAYRDEFDARKLKEPVPSDLLIEKQGNAVLKEPAEVNADLQLRSLADGQHSNKLHPAQLYSAFNALLIAALCVAFFTLAPPPGRVFALMLMVEGGTRFLLELLRAEPPVIGSFSLSMILGLGLMALGVLFWFIFGAIVRRSGSGGDVHVNSNQAIQTA
jgi:phosphatidylglycerol---prolipoprotein diacylglyceryl transferase